MLNQQRFVTLIAGAIGFVVKYIAYGFLTPVVLITFAALMFAYLNIVGNELPFFQYYSFLLPTRADGTAHLDENDILGFYNALTALFFTYLMPLSILPFSRGEAGRVGRMAKP